MDDADGVRVWLVERTYSEAREASGFRVSRT
jgi:hypothetical protein